MYRKVLYSFRPKIWNKVFSHLSQMMTISQPSPKRFNKLVLSKGLVCYHCQIRKSRSSRNSHLKARRLFHIVLVHREMSWMSTKYSLETFANFTHFQDTAAVRNTGFYNLPIVPPVILPCLKYHSNLVAIPFNPSQKKAVKLAFSSP